MHATGSCVRQVLVRTTVQVVYQPTTAVVCIISLRPAVDKRPFTPHRLNRSELVHNCDLQSSSFQFARCRRIKNKPTQFAMAAANQHEVGRCDVSLRHNSGPYVCRYVRFSLKMEKWTVQRERLFSSEKFGLKLTELQLPPSGWLHTQHHHRFTIISLEIKMQKGNYNILGMLKYTLNWKWFRSEDDITNLGEYNFMQSTCFVSIKWKMHVLTPFSIFSEKQEWR